MKYQDHISNQSFRPHSVECCNSWTELQQGAGHMLVVLYPSQAPSGSNMVEKSLYHYSCRVELYRYILNQNMIEATIHSNAKKNLLLYHNRCRTLILQRSTARTTQSAGLSSLCVISLSAPMHRAVADQQHRTQTWTHKLISQKSLRSWDTQELPLPYFREGDFRNKKK